LSVYDLGINQSKNFFKERMIDRKKFRAVLLFGVPTEGRKEMPGHSSTTKSIGVRLKNGFLDSLDTLVFEQGITRTDLMREWLEIAYADAVRRAPKAKPAPTAKTPSNS